MQQNYRNGHLALGIVIGISLSFNIVGILSVGYDWFGLERVSPNTKTLAEARCALQQAQYTAGTIPESDEPNWCDLAAQQGMANSTIGMEQAAWLALFLTAVGVFFVWRTLHYTRETLAETRTAAVFAQKSIEATLAIGGAEIRPWVTFSDVKVGSVTATANGYFSASVSAKITNSGNSAANHVMAFIHPTTAEDVSYHRERIRRFQHFMHIIPFQREILLAPGASEIVSTHVSETESQTPESSPHGMTMGFCLAAIYSSAAPNDVKSEEDREHQTVQTYDIVDSDHKRLGIPWEIALTSTYGYAAKQSGGRAS